MACWRRRRIEPRCRRHNEPAIKTETLAAARLPSPPRWLNIRAADTLRMAQFDLGGNTWRLCDHLGPVLEGDLISTKFKVINCATNAAGGQLYDLAVEAFAHRKDAVGVMQGEKVLDWGLVVWVLNGLVESYHTQPT